MSQSYDRNLPYGIT